ncbi:hypothetical protein NCAS_0D04220 [Naumovozyma castellii]|uniref:Large ribosomal subunit protein bL28m n=1 Tax=Naumovozyma castellii TaxID=27288 RepID=G0VEL2_NAUCA|nr:hypothetical protein NCAS_0D04220 [Naumovozyma castellii CBS 4309]CCC70003.1 hypothetical protein NCAS_0D04220 [Naumovozyma castellii CBS 4309]
MKAGINNVGILSTKRSFSSTIVPLKRWKLIESRKVAQKPAYKVGDVRPAYMPKKRIEFPDYKYGESQIFKQSNKGLYGGSFIQHGNNISESKQKTRRTWLPNIVRKKLWSETLNDKIDVKMTTKVLKTISKEGGIDNYLLKDKSARIKELGPTGWKLRYTVLKKKDSIENPLHKNAKLVTTPTGEQAKIYYRENVNGNKLLITAGKRKLLKLLFPLERMEQRIEGQQLNYKKFVELHSRAAVRDIVAKLEKYNFDLSTITVPNPNIQKSVSDA